MPKRFRLSARQIRSVLLRHAATGRTVIVYEHKGRDLPRPTVRAIIEGSGIPEEEFE